MIKEYAKFQEIYRKLNTTQKLAVNAIDGPVMVVAGPGTGKTHVLSARIANILKKTDTPPHAILALTYTDSAASTMRKRVVEMIGHTGYYVNISTIHSFCSDVIQSNPEYFTIAPSSKPLSEFERFDLFQKIIMKTDLEVLKPVHYPYFYLKAIINAVSDLKREGFLFEDYKQVIESEFAHLSKKATKFEKARFEKNKKKNQELLRIYTRYEKKLHEIERYDFDDMIAFVMGSFNKHEDLLRSYQEKLHYFLVDEYQDTNTTQNTIVELLARYWGQQANLFVVGDPHQSIFRFQGASIENTVSFIDRFPKAQLITLDTGYRCSSHIYSAAHDLIIHNELTSEKSIGKTVKRKLKNVLTKQLKSTTGTGERIKIIPLHSQIVESLFVTQEIQRLVKKGIKPEKVAVLYRNNTDAALFQQALEKWGISYEIEGGGNVLADEAIHQLLILFKVISDIKHAAEDEKIFHLMCFEWTAIDKGLVIKIARAAGRAKLSIADLIESGFKTFQKYHITNDVTELEFSTAEYFILQLKKWAQLDAQKIFPEWFEIVIKESGYLNWILKSEKKIESLINLNSIYQEIKSLVRDTHNLRLNDFLQVITVMQEQNLKLFAQDLNITEGAIHLSTVHKAKGREWGHVFIVGVIDGQWGNKRVSELIKLPRGLLKKTDVSKKEKNEDERRLFYVGLTRAKKSVTVSYPVTLIDNGRSKETVPSMFLEEINGKDKEIIESKEPESDTSQYIEQLLSPPSLLTFQLSERDFFQDIVEDFKLSPTALNTYLKDKKEFVENVLLRVPRAKQSHMVFGTAVHFALQKMYEKKMKKEKLKMENVIGAFEYALQREAVHETNYKELLNKGKKALRKYFETYCAEHVETLYVEQFFGFGFHKTILGDIGLTGRIDRIDWIDKHKRQVRVIDYKTGKARTIGEIEGKTVSSNLSEREQGLPESVRGPYKRQLLFYKLLTDLDRNFPYKAVEGIFDFVQSNDDEKLVRRSFEYYDEDIQDLKKLIREVMKEIRGLEFLEK